MAKPKPGLGSGPTSGNYVSEWFGHRVYPSIVSTSAAISDQQAERCPFLTAAVGDPKKCIKAEAARGVCTISSVSNGPRQDWLVCPYRALNDELVSTSIRQLFGVSAAEAICAIPAAVLTKEAVRAEALKNLSAGTKSFIYFDKKTSGELSIPATPQSPEFSFDVTIVELTLEQEQPHIGRFGILEIQTMDFHGSYRDAVRNLREGLRMHPSSFGPTVQANHWWLAEGVEGPNIANVFKRTFYQMMFKFGLGQHSRCTGCVLAIPQSVWDSWQRHLGAPPLTSYPDGTYRLLSPRATPAATCPAWIYVFDPDAASAATPSPIKLTQMIGTDAPTIAHWALEVAPAAALSNIDAEAGFLAGLSRRLKDFWPELARTVVVDAPEDAAQSASINKGRRPRGTRLTPLETIEQRSDYAGPTDGAVTSDSPDDT